MPGLYAGGSRGLVLTVLVSRRLFWTKAVDAARLFLAEGVVATTTEKKTYIYRSDGQNVLPIFRLLFSSTEKPWRWS